MRNKAIKIILLGFSEKETSQIIQISARFRADITSLVSWQRSKADWRPGSLVFVRIKSEHDLSEFRKIQINYPGFFYICVLHTKNRNLLFNLFVFNPVKILFLPFNSKEIIQIFNNIIEEKEITVERNRFFNGLEYLKQKYIWQTNEIDISTIAQYFSSLFRQYHICKNDFDEANLRLGLEEVLINSVEHGNLELHSEDREDRLQSKDKYEELKQKRYQDPRFNQRKLILELEIYLDTYTLRIWDEGPGFDISVAQDVVNGKLDLADTDIINSGGKGFWIIKGLFPSIRFEDRGRSIILSNKANK